jgi:hypothetical protein
LPGTVGSFKLLAANNEQRPCKIPQPTARRSKVLSAATEKRAVKNTPVKVLPAQRHAAQEEAEWAEL